MIRAIFIMFAIFVGMQFFQTEKTNPQTDSSLEIQTPQNIKNLLRAGCYDCHSNETKWPSYSYIAPISWSVASHVEEGRNALNFSIWETYSGEQKQKHLKEIFRTVYASMPLTSYIAFHPEADFSKEQRKEIRDWVLSLGVQP